LPRFTEGWQLGPPDLVAKMSASFAIPADGPDLYQCFVIPNAVAADRHARAMEFLPGNRKAVHHALVFADTSGEARKRAAGNPARTYPCFGVPGFLPSASLGGWTPGTEASVMPPGT